MAYLTDVIADIQAELAIDPKRIALVGHSNGGFMSYRLACDQAGLVAAIVSLAGASFADPAECAPSEPVSVAQIHGTADDVIRYGGGGPLTDVTGPYPGAETTAEAWAAYDGCGETPSELSAKVDVDVLLADGADPAETSVAEWSGCKSGATVQLWTIPAADTGRRSRRRSQTRSWTSWSTIQSRRRLTDGLTSSRSPLQLFERPGPSRWPPDRPTRRTRRR